MIQQIFLSGHVKKGARKAATVAEAKLICELMAQHNVKGLTLFSDGTFINAFEGEKHSTLTVAKAFGDHKDLSQTDIIMRLTPPIAEFKDYKIGFSGCDFSNVVPQSFRLTAESFTKAVPHNISPDLRILFQTFARVNNLDLKRSAA